MAFRPPASITNTLRRVGTSSRTDSILFTLPVIFGDGERDFESLKIQLTWLAELVSYTGTVSADGHDRHIQRGPFPAGARDDGD